MQESKSAAPMKSMSSPMASNGSITTTLHVLMEFYGLRNIEVKVIQAETIEQETQTKLLSHINAFETHPSDKNREQLTAALQDELTSWQTKQADATKKQAEFLEKARTTKTASGYFNIFGQLNTQFKTFFGSTDAQQAEKYQQVITQCVQAQQALNDYMRALNQLALSEQAIMIETTESVTAASADFPPVIPLGSLDGATGFTIDGETTDDSAGAAVSAGDINKDGFSDVVIGAPYHDSHTGAAYVVYGSEELGVNGSVALSDLTPTSGLKLPGETPYGELTGSAVSVPGDVNSDGYPDVLIGAQSYYGSTGRSYLAYGGEKMGTNGSLPLSSLDGVTGVKIDGETFGDFAGASVSGAGDINQDGHDDLAIGAPGVGGDASGAAYVVFGGPTLGQSPERSLADLTGSDGFKSASEDTNSYTGTPVVNIGDINRDGIDDFAVGAPLHDQSTGRVYVAFGSREIGDSGELPLPSLDGSNGFIIDGENPGDQLGSAIAGGDFNQDGASDLLLGAPAHDGDTGRAYVVYGGERVGSSGRVVLSELAETEGVVMDGEEAGDNLGLAVAAVGDINGGGTEDFAVGAPGHNASTGRSYVVFTEDGLHSPLELASRNGSNGFILDGEQPNSFSGAAISAGGDINGDGGDDLVVSAPGYNKTGRVYGVYGHKAHTPPSTGGDSPSYNPLAWLSLLAAIPALGVCYLIKKYRDSTEQNALREGFAPDSDFDSDRKINSSCFKFGKKSDKKDRVELAKKKSETPTTSYGSRT